jgi:hypothetical protein
MVSTAFLLIAARHRYGEYARINRVAVQRLRSSTKHCLNSGVLPAKTPQKKRADERTRTADLPSLRVIIHTLQGFAGTCKFRINKRLSLLRFAACCAVLRSRWYQSGIRIALPSARTDGGLKNRKYGLSRLCHLRKGVNIEEQARVPQNPQIRRSLGRAANLALSVHDLGGEVASVEVGHEAADLVALYLQDAHTVVGDGVAVRGALRHPLERGPLLGDEDVTEG